MALISCYECGKSISSDAVKCPQCGATNKKVKTAQMIWLVALVVAVAVSIIASILS